MIRSRLIYSLFLGYKGERGGKRMVEIVEKHIFYVVLGRGGLIYSLQVASFTHQIWPDF